MQVEKIKISKIKRNPNNPRILKDDKFVKLTKSIKEFPQMLEIRPIVVNDDMVVLGGNMRLKACVEAGLKDVPVIRAKDLTEEQQKEFIIKDNVGFGDWDWEMLANEWDVEALGEWGLDLWGAEEETDYSILDEDLEAELDAMTDGVKKAIQIEFEAEHYEEAAELVKFWRERDGYVGMMVIEKLKQAKETM